MNPIKRCKPIVVKKPYSNPPPSTSSRNTNPILPRPSQIIIPLPLLKRLMHALHIRLALLGSCHSGSSSGLLRCDKGLAGASVLVRCDVF